MDTKTLSIIGAVVLIALGAWYVLGRTNPPTAPSEATVPTENGTPGSVTEKDGDSASESGAVTVTYTDNGFSPSTASIHVGDTVTFVNQSSGKMWVGADVHPTHANYDGTTLKEHCGTGSSFDQCEATGPGTSYSFTFDKAGEFSYHNHVSARSTGTIVVQ